MRDCGYELVDNPSYSPDLAPYNYFLFPNMKKTHLAGKQYRPDDEVISAVENFFEDQDESFSTTGIAATQMEEVCGRQGRLTILKINHIWSNSTTTS